MPIRINLLAESQASEDMRRRDPVKRSILVAASLVAMVLVYSSSLQVKIMADNVQRSNLEQRLSSKTNDYVHVLDNKKELGNVNDKLAALNRLSAGRFLTAPMLDSLMHATVPGIQITKLVTLQGVDVQAEAKGTMDNGHLVNSKPAVATEKIKLILNARDSSPNPGNEQITLFREALAQSPYFKREQLSTNNISLKSLAPPQLDAESGKPYVLFVLECQFPDRVRLQ